MVSEDRDSYEGLLWRSAIIAMNLRPAVSLTKVVPYEETELKLLCSSSGPLKAVSSFVRLL